MGKSCSFKTLYFKKKGKLLHAHTGNINEFCAGDTGPETSSFFKSTRVDKLRLFSTQL